VTKRKVLKSCTIRDQVYAICIVNSFMFVDEIAAKNY